MEFNEILKILVAQAGDRWDRGWRSLPRWWSG
jgi:hypothetical protein